MPDLTFVIGKTPAEVAAQVQREEDAAQREAIKKFIGSHQASTEVKPSENGLPPPPGFVGALAKFIYQQAPRPVPEVAIVGALGLMAGIAGKVWYKPNPDTGLNLYVVLVARSAIGKEAMLSGIAKLVEVAAEQCQFAGNFVDFSDFVSGAALVKGCLAWPSLLNVAGEIGHKFLAMAVDKDASIRALRKQLITLYSKSGPADVAGGLIYSNAENNVASVKGVAFSIIGETTPSTFYESITDGMMADGFMSRFCVIEYTGDRPGKNAAPIQRPPRAVTDQLAAIVTHAHQAIITNQCQPVSFSADAQHLLDEFGLECDAAIVAAGEDEGQRQLWSRGELKALRVACLLAVGDNHLNPKVSEQQAAWAIMLVRHGITAFEKRISSGEVDEGSDGGRERKVLHLCREFVLMSDDKLPGWLKDGTAMQRAGIIPRKFLQQRTQRLAAFERHKLGHRVALNAAIAMAIDNGSIMEVKRDKVVEQFNFFGQAYRLLNLD